MRTIVLLLAAALCFGSVHAAAPFVVNADGTVTDTSTGLMWDQCQRGKSGAGCATGSPNLYNWPAALGEATTQNTANYKNYSDWRVPSILDLQTLIKAGPAPTIDTTAFPNTSWGYFWSGSSFVPAPAHAWYVAFDSGNTFHDTIAENFNVRLVRAGQYSGSFALVLGGVSGITATAAMLTATTSPAGATGYWLVVPRGAASPTVAQLIAGVGYDNVIVLAGNSAMTAKAPTGFAVSSLTAGTNYDLYLVAKESIYLTTSNVIGPLQFSTLGPYHALDVDGNAQVDALTDGLILLRYMFGLRAPALTEGALGTGATRSPAEVETYIQSIMP